MVRLSVDEKADFFEAARLSGTNLSSWARAHLRLAAISELGRMGKEPKFLGRKAPRGPGYKIVNPPRRFVVPKPEQIMAAETLAPVDVPTERVQTPPQVTEVIRQVPKSVPDPTVGVVKGQAIVPRVRVRPGPGPGAMGEPFQ